MINTIKKLKINKITEKVQGFDFYKTLMHAKNYFFSSILMQALSLISVPIFSRLLTKSDYGIIAVYNSYIGILAVIISLNVYSSISRYYYEAKDDFCEFVGTSINLLILIFCINISVYFIFYHKIVNIMKLPNGLNLYLIFSCIFMIINVIFLQIFIPQKKSKEISIIEILRKYSIFGISVAFIYFLQKDRYLGAIWGSILVQFIFSIYLLMKIFKYYKFSFKNKHIKYILYFSVPLIPYNLNAIILAQFDRIMINHYINSASTGIYSLGYTIGSLVLFPLGAIQRAIIPDFYKLRNNKEFIRINNLYKNEISIILLFALGIILFSKEIFVFLIDKKFYSSLNVVPIVVVGNIFFIMFSMYKRHFNYLKKTVYNSIIVIFSGSLNIVLNAIFIPKYGYIAGAYTTVVSYFISFLLTFIILKFVLKESITPLWVIIKPTLIMFFFMVLNHFLNTFTLKVVPCIFIKLILLALFSVIVFHREIRAILYLNK